MIPFTQYLRPDGRRTEITINRPADIEEKAQVVIAAGLFFEAEELQTGQVSLTVADREEEEDLEMELVANGPGVPAAVDRLVERAHQRVTSGYGASDRSYSDIVRDGCVE